MTANWLQMRAEEWAPGQGTLFDVDEPAAPVEAPGTLFEDGWHLAGQQPPAADGDGGRSYAAAVAHQTARRRVERAGAAVPGCSCPERDGVIRHQRATCTDPIAARLDWYAK